MFSGQHNNHCGVGYSCFTRYLLYILPIFLIIGSGVVFWYSLQQSKQLNEELSLRETSLFARSIETFRSFYVDNVTSKTQIHGLMASHEQYKPGTVPTPSVLMSQLGALLAQDTDTRYQLHFFSQHPFPWNKDGEAHDDFERWALQELTQRPDKAIWRFEEEQDGRTLLRYALPDRMEARCIRCHQSYPGTPKTDWKVGDLVGVTSISRDISEAETAASRNLGKSFLFMLALGVAGLGIVAGALHSLRQSLREAQTSSKVANEANQKLAVGIEEREMLTTTLMRTQEKIRTIVDSITDAVVVADTSGTIIETNPAVVEVFGYTQQELQGQNISLLIPTEQATAHHRAFQHYLSSGNPHIIGKRQHLQAQHKDGHIIPIEITINEARVADNIIFTSIARDISQRLAIKTALIKARDEALTATRLKSEFLANVSHEIRPPMNGIMGMTHLLLDTPLDQEQRDLATTVLHSGEHLLYVINDILDLSRIEAGKFNIYKSSFNLLQMIQGIFGLLGESAHQKGLELSFFIDSSDLGDLASDSVRLRQILINLLSNAIKFTEKGSVVLKVHIAEIKAHSMLIRFDVHDTGCGIDAESIPKLFLAFSQLDGSSTRSHGGTGLGLAISKQLAQLLGGEMGVESIPGVGSCFWFTAEVQTSRQMNQTPDQTTTAPPIVPTTQTVTDTFLHRNLRILLVEDSLVNQKVALAMLKRLGYQQTDCAANGAAALRQVQEQDYDLVLMDCQMPIMDGYEATRSIRALDDEKFRELPIIALTAHAMQGDDGKCYAAGMDDYLTKPITPVTLQSHINQWAQAKLHHQLVEV